MDCIRKTASGRVSYAFDGYLEEIAEWLTGHGAVEVRSFTWSFEDYKLEVRSFDSLYHVKIENDAPTRLKHMAEIECIMTTPELQGFVTYHDV